MSIHAGQQQYLLELLSHEYVLTEEEKPVVRQAICRYATTVYDQSELEFLLTLPQSPTACLYYPCNIQQFSMQYSLWLNLLEYAIYSDSTDLESVLLNPDPTSAEKLLAIHRNADNNLEIIPLPQLQFISSTSNSKKQHTTNISQWTLQEARTSFQLFLQLARSNGEPVNAESLSWCELLQQARLFSLTKDTYLFSASSLPFPSAGAWLQQLTPSNSHTNTINSCTWLGQPPGSPFTGNSNFFNNIKQSLSSISFPVLYPLPGRFPSFPTIPLPSRITSSFSVLPITSKKNNNAILYSSRPICKH